MKIAVIGQGYVGLPLAIAAAKVGHFVVGIDLNLARVSLLNEGRTPIGDIEDSQVAEVLASDHYSATSLFDPVGESEVVVICVPTPLHEDHSPDLAYLESALDSIGQFIKSDTLVILESTVAPGTTRNVVAMKFAENTGILVAFSPERIDPANKKWDVTNTPKLVAGLSSEATLKAADFYRSFVSQVDVFESVEVVETAKLLENSFRLINISFINEISVFCEKLGISVLDVIRAASTKPYGFMPFFPSAGIGGHCIPVDPLYLSAKAREIGAPTKFIELAHQINLERPAYFAGMAEGILGSLEGKKILVVGVAYKPDVADIRETASEPLIHTLRGMGAIVSWHDELVGNWNEEVSMPLSSEFDLVILVNPHSGTDLARLGNTRVIDTRGGVR